MALPRAPYVSGYIYTITQAELDGLSTTPTEAIGGQWKVQSPTLPGLSGGGQWSICERTEDGQAQAEVRVGEPA